MRKLFTAKICALLALTATVACERLETDEPEVPMQIGYEITVRTLGYDLTLQELRESENTLWTYTQLTPPEGMAGMALDTLRLSVNVRPTDKAVRHVITGPREAVYAAPDDVILVYTLEDAPEEFLESEVVWDRDDPTLSLPFGD